MRYVYDCGFPVPKGFRALTLAEWIFVRGPKLSPPLRGDLEFGVSVNEQNEHVIAGYGQNSGLDTIRCELHGPSNYRLLLWLGPGEQQRGEIPGKLKLRRGNQVLTNWHTGA